MPLVGGQSPCRGCDLCSAVVSCPGAYEGGPTALGRVLNKETVLPNKFTLYKPVTQPSLGWRAPVSLGAGTAWLQSLSLNIPLLPTVHL